MRLSGALGRLAARLAPTRQPRPWLTEVTMANYTADRRLWLNQDRTKVVDEGDPEAAFLLAAKGHEIDAETAKRYGLGGGAKQVASPPQDKALKAPATKGKE